MLRSDDKGCQTEACPARPHPENDHMGQLHKKLIMTDNYLLSMSFMDLSPSRNDVCGVMLHVLVVLRDSF